MNIDQAQKLIDKGLKDLIDDCPHCGAKVHIEKLWGDYHTYRNGDVEFYIFFRCRPCEKLLLKTYYLRQNEYARDQKLTSIGWGEKFPTSIDDMLSREEKELIPDQILADYQEALKCKSISANRASCSMFRRALQSSLVILGANHKLDLIKQIESLATLPPDIKDWSHQIRILGNWGAHPDKDNLKEVDSDIVAEVHDFLSKFFVYMFIMPEKVKLSRAKREEKLKKNNQEQE